MPTAAGAKLLNTQYSTQDVYAGVISGLPTPPSGISPLQRLANLNPPNMRIHAGTDGGATALALPFNAGYTSSDGLSVMAWDFNHLNSLIQNTVGRISAPAMVDVRYAPDNMFSGSGPMGGNGNSYGVLLDQTYSAFAAYMANLVKYYNTNAASPPVPGMTPWPRPAGVGPIRYWEIWNEPDFSSENPRVPPSLPAPPQVALSGIIVGGGTLIPGTSYTYQVTALTSTNQESLPSSPVSLTLPSGSNAIKVTWSPSANLSRVAAAYRVYGRAAGSTQPMVVVGKDSPGGLTFTDNGGIVPANGGPPATDNSLGGPVFSPLEYKALWDQVVPAMKAVDPTIQVVGPVATNPISLGPQSVIPTALTTSPADNSYLDLRDYVQVLMTSGNAPDVVSYHGYGGFQGAADTDSALMSRIDGIVADIRSNVLPYVGNTPVWHTEANVNAGNDTTNRPALSFGAAWDAELYARLAPLGIGVIHQFTYANSPTFGLITETGSPLPGAVAGNPYLPYWVDYWIDHLFLPGAKILSASNVPTGMDVLAVADPPDFSKVKVLVVNRQVPATNTAVPVVLAGATSSAARLRVIDSTTDLVNGPFVTALGAVQTVNLQLNGYSVGLAEFDTGGATVPGPPVNVAAVAGEALATVYWSPPATTGGSAITGYTVTATPGGVTVSVLGNATVAVVPGLQDGTAYTFTVTASNALGAGPPSLASNAVTPGRGQYHPLPPFRILDTRTGTGGVPVSPVGPGGGLNVQIAGQGGVPASGVIAVVLNVTVTDPTAASYLTVWPAGVPRPLASNLNWVAGQTVPNLVEVTVGAGGQVSLYNFSGTTDVVFDVAGYVATATLTPGPDGLYTPLVPVRVLDTRTGNGSSATPVGPGQTITVQVGGRSGSGVPSSGVAAVVLNVTATNPTVSSFLSVFPAGMARPLASNLNFVAGQTVPNRVIVTVGTNPQTGTGGWVSIYNLTGSVDVVADVGGWFTDASNPVGTGSRFVSVAPVRILDTRTGSGPLGAGATLALPVAGQAGLPLITAAIPPVAVVLNVTVTNPTTGSYLTVWPDGTSRPLASDLNYLRGLTVPNLVVVKLGSTGLVDLYNAFGSTDVIIDVVGWYG